MTDDAERAWAELGLDGQPPAPRAGRLYVEVTVGDAYEVEGECPDCGFNALVQFGVYAMGENGPNLLGTKTLCVRCLDETSPSQETGEGRG